MTPQIPTNAPTVTPVGQTRSVPERWPRWKTDYVICRRWRSRRGSSLWPSSASWRGQRRRILRRRLSMLAPWVRLEPWRRIWGHVGISRRSHDPTVPLGPHPLTLLHSHPPPHIHGAYHVVRPSFLTVMSALRSAVVQSRFNHRAYNCSRKFVKTINPHPVARKITRTPQRSKQGSILRSLPEHM